MTRITNNLLISAPIKDWPIITAPFSGEPDQVRAKAAAWINAMALTCFDASRERGWWNDPATGELILLTPTVIASKLCLIHSEVSEALEGVRKNKQDDHLPHRLSVEVELADALIRIFDLAGRMGLDLGGAVLEKMAYNALRADHDPANRAAAGGKAI